jgi:hypothetical protein
MFASGPLPLVRQSNPHDNVVSDVKVLADRFHCIRIPDLPDLLPLAHNRLNPNVASRLRPTLRQADDDVGVEHPRTVFMSPMFQAAIAARAVSTFSFDIAYPDSPTASRADSQSP